MRKLVLVLFISVINFFAHAANKVSVASGDWSNSSIWSPAGVPTSSDDVTIAAGNVVQININAGSKSLHVIATAQCKLISGKKLTLNGPLSVDGLLDMNGGDITQSLTNATFSIGNTGTFIWNPGDNTVGGATLFARSIESFSASSTLSINKWYSFTTVPLGSVVTGNFGNVKINTRIGNTLFEWNQDNQFETHEIKGTLTIDDGWVVLDKSGKISNTKIGNIVLSSMNSVLDLHSGTHPSSFQVTVDSIANIGGELNGIFNGDGNIHLNVLKGFLNMGNVELIYNAGVANLGKGNAQLTVGGKLKQTHGDFRGIFNLSTVKAGKVDMTIRDLELYGGIFMCFYGCNESGVQNTLTVQQNLVVDFANASDKFRINGLTTLMGQYSKARSLLTVNGITKLSGDAAAEFTSSGSVGAEENNFMGDVIISGLTNNFNYGSHTIQLNVGGDFNVNGGTTCLSKMPGIGIYNFSKKLKISSGILMLKNNVGTVNANLQGDYVQSGGLMLFHSNNLTASADSINLSVFGKFHHLNGVLNFDDNLQGSNNTALKIYGEEFQASGNALMTRAGAGAGTFFGRLTFARQGTVLYKRSVAAVIDQIKQTIAKGCTVQMTEGNFMVSSHQVAATDYLTISPSAQLILNNAQIISNARYANSGISVQSQGVLTFSRTEGLYNKSESAAICSKGNMDFSLDNQSIVEYAGTNQLITGTDPLSSPSKQYGSLKIAGSAFAGANVVVRSSIEINNGFIDLNNQKLVLNNGNPVAVKIINGYFKCRSESDKLEWQDLQIGKTYTIPFSANGQIISKMQLTPSQNGNAIVYSYPSSTMSSAMPAGVTPLISDSKDITDISLVKRWFGIQGNFKTDITLNYSKSELPQGLTEDDGLMLMQFQNGWKNTGKTAMPAGDEMQQVSLQNVFANGIFVLAKSGDINIPQVETPSENPSETASGDLNIISAFPNPFDQYLKVNFNTPSNGIAEISLVNAEGKLCYKTQQQVTNGANEFILPESLQLPPGVYFLELKGFKKSIVKKLIHR